MAGARAGDEYRFLVRAGGEELSRLDPRARQLTSSVGNAVVYDPAAFDWGKGEFATPAWNDLVIYEMHVGTFSEGMHGQPGTLEGVRRRLGYLRELGIGAIQLMPPFEFAGDRSWGYNPAYPFAVESAYGDPDDLKALVRAAHEAGIAVLLDVVYNHLGPSDLDLWRFDGWSENDKGGIYFYQDDRSSTPWGETRPDYGRPEVRAFLRDNAMTWLDEFRIDGLRWDATAYISSITGGGSGAPDRIAEGWDAHGGHQRRGRGALPRPADDRRGPAQRRGHHAAHGGGWRGLRGPVGSGLRAPRARGAHRTRATRSATSMRSPAPCMVDPADAFKRVIYTESHDEVANGSSRVPEEIWPGYADSWPSRKRAALGAALVLTAPGHPHALPGSGAHRGFLVHRRGAARLEQAPPPRRAPAAPSRPHPPAAQRRRHDARAAGPPHHGASPRPRGEGPGLPPLGGRRAA